MVTIVEDAAIISAVAAILLALFTIMQLRHLEKHRNVEVSMRLFEWAETDRLRQAFKWMEKKYQFNNYAEYKLLEENDEKTNEYPVEVTAFFEELGFLVEKKFVDIDVVADRLGSHIVLNWRKLEPWIAGVRKEKNDPTYGEHFANLYSMTCRYVKKNCASRKI